MNLLILVILVGMLFCVSKASQTNSLNKQDLSLQRRDGHHKKHHKHHNGGHRKHHNHKIKRDKISDDHLQLHGRYEKRGYEQTLQYIRAAVDSYKKEKGMNKNSDFLNSVSYSSRPENSLLDRLAAVAPSSPSYSIQQIPEQDQTLLNSPAYSVARKVVEAKLSPNKKIMPVYSTMPNFFIPVQPQQQQQRVKQQQLKQKNVQKQQVKQQKAQLQEVQPQKIQPQQLQSQQVQPQQIQPQQVQPQQIQPQQVQQVQQVTPVLSKENLTVDVSMPSSSASLGMSAMTSEPMAPPPPEITYSPPPPPNTNTSLQAVQIPAQNLNREQSAPPPSAPLPSPIEQSSPTTITVAEVPPVPQVAINAIADQEASLRQNSESQLSVQEQQPQQNLSLPSQESIPPQDYSSQLGSSTDQSMQQVPSLQQDPSSQQEALTNQNVQQVSVPQLEYSSQQEIPANQNLQQIVSPQEQQQQEQQQEYLADQIQSTQQLSIPQQDNISQQLTEQSQQNAQTTEQNLLSPEQNYLTGPQQQASILEPQQTSELSIQSDSIALPTTDQLQLSNKEPSLA